MDLKTNNFISLIDVNYKVNYCDKVFFMWFNITYLIDKDV